MILKIECGSNFFRNCVWVDECGVQDKNYCLAKSAGKEYNIIYQYLFP